MTSSFFFPVHQSPSEKGSAFKGKNVAPRGIVDYLSDGHKNNFDKVLSF